MIILPLTTDKVTFVVAMWGAVLSTALAVLTVLQHWSDRARLKVRVMFTEEYESSESDRYILSAPAVPVLTVTNVGRRPVKVLGVAVQVSPEWRQRWGFAEKFSLTDPKLPVVLGEGDFVKLSGKLYTAWVTDGRVERMWVRGLDGEVLAGSSTEDAAAKASARLTRSSDRP